MLCVGRGISGANRRRVGYSLNKTLEKVHKIVKYAMNHEKWKTFSDKMVRDIAFYTANPKIKWSYNGITGRGQWLDKDLAILEERSQTPHTANIMKRLILAMSSAEIATRRRIGYRSSLYDDTNIFLADVLTRFAYYVQEQEGISQATSHAIKDVLITGLGVVNLFQCPEDGIQFEYVHPMNIILDMDDFTPTFSNMRYVIRKRYLPEEYVVNHWPNFRKFASKDKDGFTEGDKSGEYDIDKGDSDFSDPFASEGVVLVYEVQHKEQAKYYSGKISEDKFWTSFKRDDFSKSENPEEKWATRIIRTLFAGPCLLESEPLTPQIPNQDDFTYIPLIYEKDRILNLPDGMVSSMISSQIDVNQRKTSTNYLINAQRVVITGAPKQDLKKIEAEVRRKDVIVFADADIKVESHSFLDVASAHHNQYIASLAELEKETGIHPEMMGDTSGANQSGRAIQLLKTASLNGHNFLFDGISHFRKRLGSNLLSILQHSNNIASFILRSEETDEAAAKDIERLDVILNDTGDSDNEIQQNDIRGVPFAIYVEETPDFESSVHEVKATMESLLGSQNAETVLGNKSLLQLLGIRNAGAIVKEMEENRVKKQQEQQKMQEQLMQKKMEMSQAGANVPPEQAQQTEQPQQPVQQ